MEVFRQTDVELIMKTNILTLILVIIYSNLGICQNCGTSPNDSILEEKNMCFLSTTGDSLKRTSIARFNGNGKVVSITTITHDYNDTTYIYYNYDNQKLLNIVEYSEDTNKTIISGWNENLVATKSYPKMDSTSYTESIYKGCYILKKEHYSSNLKVIETNFKWENNLLMTVETHLTDNIKTSEIKDRIMNYKYTKFDQFGNWTERLVISNIDNPYLERRILEYK